MENGYLGNEELFNENKTKYTDLLHHIYRTGIENGATFNDMENTDVCAYIDYLIFCLDNPKENKEN